ncbi:MAG: hypothetical protein AAGE52_21440 [Myxococcota bacterium]
MIARVVFLLCVAFSVRAAAQPELVVVCEGDRVELRSQLLRQLQVELSGRAANARPLRLETERCDRLEQVTLVDDGEAETLRLDDAPPSQRVRVMAMLLAERLRVADGSGDATAETPEVDERADARTAEEPGQLDAPASGVASSDPDANSSDANPGGETTSDALSDAGSSDASSSDASSDPDASSSDARFAWSVSVFGARSADSPLLDVGTGFRVYATARLGFEIAAHLIFGRGDDPLGEIRLLAPALGLSALVDLWHTQRVALLARVELRTGATFLRGSPASDAIERTDQRQVTAELAVGGALQWRPRPRWSLGLDARIGALLRGVAGTADDRVVVGYRRWLFRAGLTFARAFG